MPGSEREIPAITPSHCAQHGPRECPQSAGASAERMLLPANMSHGLLLARIRARVPGSAALHLETAVRSHRHEACHDQHEALHEEDWSSRGTSTSRQASAMQPSGLSRTGLRARQ